MKKLFILSFSSILLLTGCGATETLSCTYQTDANNGSTQVKYDIDHQDNEIKKVRITYDYDFNTDNNGNNANGANNARISGDNTTGTTNGNNNNTEADVTTGTTDGNNGNNGNGTTAGTTNGNGVTGDGTTTGATNGNGMGTNTNNGITGYNNANNDDTQIDGVGTGTDGTTNDTQIDDDGIVDGVVGSVIDSIVGGVTSIILDSAGLRDRHAAVQNTYGNVNGFSVQNTNDANDNYTVTYVIDYDTISDDDLASFNLSRDLDDMRDSYVNQGFTCK